MLHPAEPPLPTVFLNEDAATVIQTETSTVTIRNLEEILAPASDLVTTKYMYTDADIFEDYKSLNGMKMPLTTNKTVFTYSGTLRIGVDLSQVRFALDNDARTIRVQLPPVQVLSHDIDPASFRYYDVSKSVFNATEMGDVTELIRQLKAEKEAQARENPEVWDQADTDARNVIRGFLTSSELTRDYTVIFE